MIAMLDPKTLTVLVTGATAGFGAATARRFAQAGSKVIATGRRADRLAALKKELGARCHIAAYDVTDRAAADKMVKELPAEFARINIVVANAGGAFGLEPAHQADLKDWEKMIEVNINGLLYTIRATLPGMVERDEGHVVTLGSVAGDYPYPGGNVYGGVKAFVKQFALNVRADILGANVRVTNVEPGLAETEFSIVRFKGDKEKAAKVYEGVQPMTAEDIAEQIFFVCTLPRHVNINRIQSMATMQAFGPFAIKRK
ncbi:MAG: SDR family NAD(P)-dependent oxidoreductase [Xanthobacteraceae bacterium]